ncbi:hypothetical protein QQP08_024810 [Theobroma cacao]|nr:hypothetical protein QQP08_024810 [Theobroma cacao]
MQAKNKGITIYLIQPVAAKARLVLHLYNFRINRLKEIVIKPEKKKKMIIHFKSRQHDRKGTHPEEPKEKNKGAFPQKPVFNQQVIQVFNGMKPARIDLYKLWTTLLTCLVSRMERTLFDLNLMIQNLKNKDVSSIKSCKERNGDVKVGANFRPNRVITMTFLVV